jgi:excisionase family DNA binding protein
MRDVFMQTAEVAQLAGVTPDAIRRAVRDGRLRVALTTGRGFQLYDRGDVDAYCAKRLVPLMKRTQTRSSRRPRRTDLESGQDSRRRESGTGGRRPRGEDA